MIIRILIFLLMTVSCYADTLTIPTTYSTNGQVTATNLNGNFSAVAAKVNGGLDNDNANTTSGYRFFETKSTLPTAGSQGRTVFLTSDNTLNLDTGSAFVKSVVVTGTPTSNQIPVYNGSAWVPTDKANIGFTSGMIVMWSGTVATIPSGWYLCDGSNGTPDLRDKFVVGAKQDSGGVAKTNITGSLTQSGGSTTITTGNLPASGLTLSIPLYSPNAGGSSGVPQNTPGPSDTTSATYTTSNMGSGNPYTQPYYALAFIMKS